MRPAPLLACLCILAGPAAAQSPPPVTAPFRIHAVAKGIGQGYQALVTDMNHDGRPDIIALGLTAGTLAWYENPGWTPHVITTTATTPKMVILDAADIDGDGIPEIALAYDFNANPTRSAGSIAILHHDGDPRGPWKIWRAIDRVPATHRLAFADVDGSGRLALAAAPILNAKSTGFADPGHLPTPLMIYRPQNGWRREVVTRANRGVVHGLHAFDWFGDGRQELFTQGYSGVYMHMWRGGRWRRTLLVPGNVAPWPKGGASDMAAGWLHGRRFFVTIEPFHGNMVAVYTPDGHGGYARNVIETGLKNGHALTLVDVDGDGVPEIVAGGNGSPTSMYFYKATDASARHWTRMQMDDDMAPASCVTADIAGTGHHNDVVCQDMRPPYWLKWYEYTGPYMAR